MSQDATLMRILYHPDVIFRTQYYERVAAAASTHHCVSVVRLVTANGKPTVLIEWPAPVSDGPQH